MRAPGEYRVVGRRRPSSKQIRASCALSTEGLDSACESPSNLHVCLPLTVLESVLHRTVKYRLCWQHLRDQD